MLVAPFTSVIVSSFPSTRTRNVDTAFVTGFRTGAPPQVRESNVPSVGVVVNSSPRSVYRPVMFMKYEFTQVAYVNCISPYC